VLVAAICSALLGALHAGLCSLTRINDIAMGIAIMLAGTGIAFFFGKPYVQPSAPLLPTIPLGFWSDSSQIRSALDVSPLFFIGVLVGIFMTWALQNTRAGMVVRIVGDSADAARAMGLRINLVRLAATAAGSALAGVGGAFLSLVYPGSWNEGLSSGQGLIAVALVVFARWEPLACIGAALLFGAAGALGPSLQTVGVTQGYYLFNAAPYLLTLALMFLAVSGGRRMRGAPGELSIVR
jgi:simple sugar transport system permease protein